MLKYLQGTKAVPHSPEFREISVCRKKDKANMKYGKMLRMMKPGEGYMDVPCANLATSF